MTFKVILAVLVAYVACAKVATIDDERGPVTRAEAVVQVIVNAAIIYGLFHWC